MAILNLDVISYDRTISCKYKGSTELVNGNIVTLTGEREAGNQELRFATEPKEGCEVCLVADSMHYYDIVSQNEDDFKLAKEGIARIYPLDPGDEFTASKKECFATGLKKGDYIKIKAGDAKWAKATNAAEAMGQIVGEKVLNGQPSLTVRIMRHN